MNAISVVICVAVVILAVLITLFAYILWKYVKLENKNNLAEKEEDVSFLEDYYKFQIPVSLRTVQAQAPFLKQELGVTGVTVTAPSDEDEVENLKLPEKRQRKPRSRTLDEGMLNLVPNGKPVVRKRAESLKGVLFTKPSENVPGKRPLQPLPNSSLTENELRQKKINATMMATLASQHGPTLTSRRESYLGLEDSQSSLYNLSDDGSDFSFSGSLMSLDDVYDSTSVGGPRTRLSRTRGASNKSEQKKISYRKAGIISFTTLYNEDEHILEVHIIRLTDLSAKRQLSEVNPFVRVYLEPGKKQKQNTKYQKETRNPYINETLTFSDLSVDDLAKHKIKMKVYHHGILRRSEIMGEVDVALSSINIQLKEQFDVDLFIKRSESTSASLNITLCHQATYSKLEVIMHEAKNLAKKSSSLNPYASISLFKENSTEKKDTTTKRKTRNPTFNECLDFDITTNPSTPLEVFSLAVTLFNHNLVGKDDVLGYVIFSSSSPQESAADHWREVQNEPHKRITKWHHLIDAKDI
ncbi:synaptotagmin-7-like [Hydractinia symbiolongicarpus]|uniref:synaptotagmin-7-like n=1 Tax=Hydractinia symbiolongicarpus TaxID=13093 RepID=UPI002549C778|nr:synaptotagmin-7-like [Hydractinia symbiolongicarpus]